MANNHMHPSSRMYESEKLAFSKRNSEVQNKKYEIGWNKGGILYVSRSNPNYEKIKGRNPYSHLTKEEYSLSRKAGAKAAGKVNSKPFIEINSGLKFANGVEAAKYFGVSTVYISNVLNGKSVSRKWRFKYTYDYQSQHV